MRWIKHIVVHSTGTDTEKKARNFFKDQTPIYHFVIERDGEIVTTCGEHRIVESFKKEDFTSIHIAYIGGIDKDGKPINNMSKLQQEALFFKLAELSSHYYNAAIIGADEMDIQANSPGFNMKQWLNGYEPNYCLDKETFSMAA